MVNQALSFLASVMLAGLILTACSRPNADVGQGLAENKTPISLSYASRFEIWDSGGILQLTISSGVPYLDSITYSLIPEQAPVPAERPNHQIIRIPVQNMVVTSTSHIPFLELLGISDRLVGFPNTNFISSPLMRSRIEQGLVADVGSVNGVNFESLISLDPELVVTYVAGSDHSELDQLDQSGIPWILNLDFMEETPLGRAEWIKFMGLLTGKFKQADSVFKMIESRYLEMTDFTDTLSNRPTVFCGIMYGDTWFAPGAKSFAANLIEDAGGSYSWKDLDRAGSVELSLEAVMDRNVNTDYWIGTGEYTSREALKTADSRYALFEAFNNGQVYNYHGKIGATGGFEYFELGGARPDLVLGDLIKILHPDLLPGHQMYFYKKLD